MVITAEMLDKVSEIVRTELPKRLPESIRVRRVESEIWPGIENEIIHVLVVYEGDRKDLNPRMLNEFDDEIEPMLSALNRSQGEIYICSAERVGLGVGD